MHHSPRAPLRAALVLSVAASVLASCGGLFSSADTRARDRGLVFPTGRAEWRFDERDGDGRRAQFEQGVEAEMSFASGAFDVSNGVGRTDYDLLHGGIAYRAGPSWTWGELHGLAGLMAQRLEFDGSPAATRSETYVGPMLGGEARFRPIDRLALYGRGVLGHLESGSYSTWWEVGAAFEVASRVELLAAFRRWDAEYGSFAPLGRDANLDFEGLVLGVAVRF